MSESGTCTYPFVGYVVDVEVDVEHLLLFAQNISNKLIFTSLVS